MRRTNPPAHLLVRRNSFSSRRNLLRSRQRHHLPRHRHFRHRRARRQLCRPRFPPRQNLLRWSRAARQPPRLSPLLPRQSRRNPPRPFPLVRLLLCTFHFSPYTFHGFALFLTRRRCASLGTKSMTASPEPREFRFKPRALVMLAAFAIAAAYAVFIIVARYESDRALERRNAQEAAEKRLADDRAAVEQLGGSELAIRALYVSPSPIRPRH